MHSLGARMLEGELADIVGAENVLTDAADLTSYGLDYFWLPRMLVDRGQLPPLPDLVVLPQTKEQVARIVKLANANLIPVVAWGGGSGTQGGIMPMHGGITVDLKGLNRVLEIDDVSLTVTAEAGISGFVLEDCLHRRGLTLPQYPASVHSATLGGYLAARGSGVLSTKYGKAEDMVVNLEVVLPNGDIVRTLPYPKHASGPDIMQLFVGAEGSFGLITEATMRIEHVPEERRFRAVLFNTLAAGFESGRRMMTERLQPTVIRLYDEPSTIKVVKRVLGLEVESGAYMVFGFDGRRDIVAIQEQRALEICAEGGAKDLGAEPGWRWWQQRYDFYFPPHTLDFPWMFGTMDTMASYGRLLGLHEARKHELESRFSGWGLVYIAHFSHWYPWGAMIYDRFIVERPPSDPYEALALHNSIWDTAVRVALAFGGVLNEHHGVGLKLGRHVREQYGPAYQVLEGIKNQLDPHHLLNPGKMGFGPPR